MAQHVASSDQAEDPAVVPQCLRYNTHTELEPSSCLVISHDVDEAVLLSDRICMMTNGPEATVGEILNIDLPRPRDRLELAEDIHYNNLRSEVLKFLYDKQRKTVVH